MKSFFNKWKVFNRNNFLFDGSVFILMLIFASLSISQRYKYKHEKENVEIKYKWKRSSLFNDDERNLVLYLANKNDYRVEVSFVIDVFKNVSRHSSSDTLIYCIPPNYEILGRFRHLEFATTLDWTTMESDTVRWEINNMNVVKDPDCTTKANSRY